MVALWPFAAFGLLCLLIFLGFGLVSQGKSGRSKPHSLALMAQAVPNPKPQTEAQGADPSTGIFRVESQPEEQPVVAIENSTGYDLRLDMQDENGKVHSEWIPADTSKDLTIGEGQYNATIQAPDAFGVVPSNGTLDVRNFHHYQADFTLTPESDVPPNFHIGE